MLVFFYEEVWEYNMCLYIQRRPPKTVTTPLCSFPLLWHRLVNKRSHIHHSVNSLTDIHSTTHSISRVSLFPYTSIFGRKYFLMKKINTLIFCSSLHCWTCSPKTTMHPGMVFKTKNCSIGHLVDSPVFKHINSRQSKSRLIANIEDT